MFNSNILDVAIGMIFIYLLLSLMCSAANEIIELMLKKRAVDLERGIRELLVPGSASGTNDVVQKLYNHPLVNGLFGGRYEKSRIESTIKRKIMRTGLPSYIPARTFALALMDLVLPGTAGAATPSGAAGATPPANFEVKMDTPPPPPLPITNPANPLIPLRSAVLSSVLLTPHAKEALTTLIDAAGSDVAKARENIEGWFNNSMDRVSSWYKRRVQLTILVLGLFVAIAVNADTITVVKKLSTAKALRESLVGAADAYAKANALPAATPAPAPTPTADANGQTPPPPRPTPTPTPMPLPSPLPECVKEPNSPECAKAIEAACEFPDSDKCIIAKGCTDPNSPACQQARVLAAACRDQNSPKCRYLSNEQQLRALGLPIGWDSPDDPTRKWPGLNVAQPGGWFYQLYWHWLGWLLTALAISLGAPFWFDLLNKFIVIRSAVKPHEKSPEEESKD